jgi:hypothetical protein
MKCDVTGNPKPSIKWTKMDRHSNVLSVESILTITITGKSDEGTYQCEAQNGIGNSSVDMATIFVTRELFF